MRLLLLLLLQWWLLLLRWLRVGLLRVGGLAVLLLLLRLLRWRRWLLPRVKRPANGSTGWLLKGLLIGHRLLLLGLGRSRESVRGRVGRGTLLLRIHPAVVAASIAMVVIFTDCQFGTLRGRKKIPLAQTGRACWIRHLGIFGGYLSTFGHGIAHLPLPAVRASNI